MSDAFAFASPLIAGDSFRATVQAGGYPASTGWVAELRLIGGGVNKFIEGVDAGGGAWSFVALSADTAGYPAGVYRTVALFNHSGDRASLSGPQLTVTPDPAAAGTVDLRGTARKALEDLQAAYRAYAVSGQLMASYTIGTRTVQFATISDLLRAIDAAKREAAAEDAALGLQSGGSAGGRIVVRM